ncbi:cation:proton antiporter [Clostridium taeniosporum]|uniref:Sodium:proton antiporter n=1 Tax=Clostridium taeniosporum TaxID=394958 RepID=A0A1D7XJ31_9CLOT|nr:cation:proton antiporter [Clostridium taeniosporum]AOR23344.1 sodium:proton antiporter [Clostridium taeniosporum]
MEEAINFESILIISVLAFITPLFINSFKKIKIPFVVGEIFIGLIFGKSFLNLVHEDVWIVFLSNLGLAYLMFLSGLEIDFNQFKSDENGNKTAKTLLICFVMLIISLIVSYGISIYFVKVGIIKDVFFSTFLLTATAPGLLVPLLKERNLLDSDYGQTLLIFSLFCEFVCLIAITILSTIIDSGLSYKNFLFTILIVLSYVIYRFIKKSIKKFRFSIENFKGLHIEVRAAFALIIILVSVSHALGAEIVMGSFLAGVIFSLISGYNREDLKEKLDIIGYGFLIPIFFIQLGVNLDIKTIFNDVKMLAFIPLLLIAFYVVKLFASLLLSLLFGTNKAISGGFILSSQLSLMIVGLQIAYSLNVISDSVYTLFIVTTIMSCFIFPILFDKIFKYDGIATKKSSALDKICIRERVLTNSNLVDKPLKEIKFPPSCRIVMIMRGSEEILPNGETILRKGDILLLAGIKSNEGEMLDMVTRTII